MNLNVYPNPTISNLTVELDSKKLNQEYSISIYDINAMELINNTIQTGKNDIDLSDLTSEIYHYHVIDLESGEIVLTSDLIKL